VPGRLALGLALGAELPADATPRHRARVGFPIGRLEGLGELRRAPVRTSESCVSRSNSSFVWIFDRGSVDGAQALDEEPGGVPSGASGKSRSARTVRPRRCRLSWSGPTQGG
jgi:hypothetical protein